jgi:hypothetical protein
MKYKNIMMFLVIVLYTSDALSSSLYTEYFTGKTMRVDYYHSGTKGQEFFSIDRIYEENEWSGSKNNLLDTLNLGEYLVKIFDVRTNTLIFSRGYSTVFNEWQTTDEPSKGLYKTFHETIRLPFPKQKIQMVISRRDKQMFFRELFSLVIDPYDKVIISHDSRSYNFKATQLLNNGPSSEKVDILILGDGYRKKDIDKFHLDAKKYNDAMFNTSPFKEYKNDFNVWIIDVISQDSGIDKPDVGIWKNSALGTTYNFFGSARYILTEENRTMRDIASAVPYDFINILINDNRYGGGGIYNLYTTTYTVGDTPGKDWQMEYVYVHEFGHNFGGLGDEYYSSQVSYTDFYTKGIEPWEPNVTASNNLDDLKWKIFVKETTPIPTPWEKPAYDSLENERAKLDRLAPDYYQKREPLYTQSMQILKSSNYAGVVGAFEGAGYVSKGLYRPCIDCRMFSLSLADFDPVCRASIEKVIKFYSK